jgi:hypothetical protein
MPVGSPAPSKYLIVPHYGGPLREESFSVARARVSKKDAVREAWRAYGV